MRTSTPCCVARPGHLRGQLGIGLGRAGPHQLDREHATAAADVADRGHLVGDHLQAVLGQGLDPLRGAQQVLRAHRLDRGQRGGAGHRVAAVRAAQATAVHGVHHLGAAHDARERQPARDALGDGHQVGDHTLVVGGEPRPVRPNPVCTSSATKTIPLLGAPPRSAGRKPGAGSMKPPSPWIGSMTSAAIWSAPTCLLDLVDRPGGGLLAGHALGGRGSRRPPGRGRPRARTGRSPLVGHGLGGQRHREVGAAVVAVVEDDDRGTIGRARAIFTAFSTASAPELNSATFLAWSPGVSSASASHDRDVPLVRRDHETGVGEVGELRGAPPRRPRGRRPTDVTAIPEPKSISRLPSTSSMTPPPARAT